ncbi:hypothetical protein KP509_09G011100 [Ceratopteris richardii]|nr:hypothetical protein KP509_09G011100 [Ceratopteris richardii]
MLVAENFAAQRGMVLCGVFDGHGVDGHHVARSIRDMLQQKLTTSWRCQRQVLRESSHSLDKDYDEDLCSEKFSSEFLAVDTWKEALKMTFNLMDEELLTQHGIDSISSGTTAVVLVKQGNDLAVGNVGDSRAVLGAKADDGSLIAVQLTIDHKPEIPREAERIKRYDGRVFALQREPCVLRVWLPHRNVPGLAMSRALGDYCLKNHGVISVPEVTYRCLTKRDQFVVLATDGVWDVLSNEEVVSIVANVRDRALAARAVVEMALYVWKSDYPFSRIDDCSVVCLFL